MSRPPSKQRSTNHKAPETGPAWEAGRPALGKRTVIDNSEPGDDMDQLLYEIERFDPAVEVERAVESVQLIRRGESLWQRTGNAPEKALGQLDPHEAIGRIPELAQVRTNQITRITCLPEIEGKLPLVLEVVGEIPDLEQAAWAPHWQNQIEVEEDADNWSTGMSCVVQVNGRRWAAWRTPEGRVLLPVDPEESWRPLIDPVWAELRFIEWGSRTSGWDSSAVGPVTSDFVAMVVAWDEGGESTVWVRPRGDEAVGIVEWLLEGPMTGEFVQMWGDEAPFAGLFIEAAVHGSNGQGVAGSSLGGDHDEDTMGMTRQQRVDPQRQSAARND